MDKRYKELIWLTKEEAEIIVTYFRIMYLWNPKIKEIFDQEDIEEFLNIVNELSSCSVAVILSNKIYNQVKYLVNFDVESIFFKDHCSDLLFSTINEKINEYKKIYIDQT